MASMYSQHYAQNPRNRRLRSDKRPRKINLTMWDVNTEKTKIIRRNLTENQWDVYAWKLENSGGFGPMYYGGLVVPINNMGHKKGRVR